MLVDPVAAAGGCPPRTTPRFTRPSRGGRRGIDVRSSVLCAGKDLGKVRVPLTDETQARIKETVDDGKADDAGDIHCPERRVGVSLAPRLKALSYRIVRCGPLK